MTKGLFTLIPLFTGVMGGWALHRQWRKVFDWRWLLVGGLILLLSFPLFWGYYTQFDAQPEKMVEVGSWGQRTQVSGIKFFLWDSQFGRFFNVGPIRGKGNPGFFFHTLLWAFLPWGILLYLAVLHRFRNRIQQSGEWFTLSAALPMFVVFSLSRFQLPHYLNILFPFFAILVAGYLLSPQISLSALRRLDRLQLMVLSLVVLLTVAFFLLYRPKFPPADALVVLLGSGLLCGYLYLGQKTYLKRILIGGALIVLTVNFLLNRAFFPELLTYQAGQQAAAFVKVEKLARDRVVALGMVSASLDFYLNHVVPYMSLEEIEQATDVPLYVYTGEAGWNSLKAKGLRTQALAAFQDFQITTLSREFLQPATRANEILKVYILKVWQDETRFSDDGKTAN
jgi:4-amino-4-deoxy-L-arabinose transferase-like glycosyltransferase